MSIFLKPKSKPTRAEALAALRNTLRDATTAASDCNVHPTEIERAFEGALQAFRTHLALSTPIS